MKKEFVTALLALFLLGGANSPAQAKPHELGSGLVVENLSENQTIMENTPAEFRILAPAGVSSVKAFANGVELGTASLDEGKNHFHFDYTFTASGEQELLFTALAKDQMEPMASVSYRIQVIPEESVTSRRLFNPWILKAVSYLSGNYGLLGYNINAQLTHPLQYFKYGTLKPTKGGLTMCVAGVLEVIITAFDFYSKETGDYSLYSFLPFSSWNSLDADAIKAHIWVNEKLKAYGTADAISKFGIGEHFKFKDLEPGSFVNINRTSGSGHAVVFLNFINSKGEAVRNYDSSVVGFRYFGAQGKSKKGEGGLSYRHAFFSQFGCPEVPYKRDCNVIYSEDQRLLNVGQMLHPKEWKRKALGVEELPPLSPEEQASIHSPLEFDGHTTDD